MSVTIRDVAKEAGVSTATVSKVLSGSHTISEATAQNVLKAVKKLNYLPNERARSFAKRQTHSILFLAAFPEKAAYHNPHLFEIMAGAQQALDKRGYRLSIRHTAPIDAIALTEALSAQKAYDGIIFHASVVTKKLAALIGKQEIPHIVIGQPHFETRLCWIDTNHCLSGEVAAQHLIEKGHTKIAFIGGKPDDMISWNRLRGVRLMLDEHSISLPKAYAIQSDSDIKDGHRMAKALLKLPDPPTAVICANNPIAMGCMQYLNEKHIAIPNAMAVMTFDSYPFSQITEPKLTVVDVNMYDMGAQAARLLIEKIRKPSLQTQSFATLPELIIREST